MTGNLTCQLQSSEHRLIKRIIQGSRTMMRYLLVCSTLVISGLSTVLAATTAGNTLQAVDFAALPGNKAQITLTLSQAAATPLSFTIDNPARIALDFPNTNNGLTDRSQAIGIGMAESMTVVEAQGRTRVVVNLVDMVPYEAHAEARAVSSQQPRQRSPVVLEALLTGWTISTFVAGKMVRDALLSACPTRPFPLTCNRKGARSYLISIAQSFLRISNAAWT
jgi:hypothetical protein